ncbi:hypothetical protein NA57DRAFT_33024 [Rhizodiscina lignyota]|uniref:NAD(P)-binding domain-containing protein n=1 Tax=Rhizodiscina lignyota TaxID=1504668 RepID=A0A9P4ISR4_9PEZI|nr:hypothetical protein NA57DRAFT_33024 [Rhizodiscina lignyota]
MSTPHILLLGGHGKIAQLMTPLFLARSWTVTSMIRTAEQTSTIEGLGKSQPGKLNVLVSSIEEVKTNEDAKKIIDSVKPTWIVWSAGAGGKGGPSRTDAVDHIAAKRFIHAAFYTPSITKFLLISYIGSRRNKPSWWTEDAWKASLHVNENVLAAYHVAKLKADEYFQSAFEAAKAGKRPGGAEFAAIDLRPGSLTDEPAGKVQLGKTEGSGKSSRARVAEITAALLESGYKGGWVDMLDGDETVSDAVQRVTKANEDAIEGEDVEAMKPLFEKE